mmetsp:Transcript_171845/g.550684  ORF Transcript_171845/g.550684 Transcript_171845/m.550684 type:complete len:128 (-) Transcript_171845:26-409(-)
MCTRMVVLHQHMSRRFKLLACLHVFILQELVEQSVFSLVLALFEQLEHSLVFCQRDACESACSHPPGVGLADILALVLSHLSRLSILYCVVSELFAHLHVLILQELAAQTVSHSCLPTCVHTRNYCP